MRRAESGGIALAACTASAFQFTVRLSTATVASLTEYPSPADESSWSIKTLLRKRLRLKYCLAAATAFFCCCVRAGVVTGGAVTGGAVVGAAVAGALTGCDAQTSTAPLPDLVTERTFPNR